MPVVRDGWIRLVPGGMPMQAGFGRIENACAMPATIVGARSAAHASAELHETQDRRRREPHARGAGIAHRAAMTRRCSSPADCT